MGKNKQNMGPLGTSSMCTDCLCSSKVAGSLYAINRIKHFISRKYLRALYFSMIYPYISYGIPIWGSTYSVHKRKLVVMQKRAVRTIAGAPYNETTNPLFHQLHLLKLDDIYKTEVAKIVFKYQNNCLPSPLMKLFYLKSEVNTRVTVQCNDLYPKRCRTTLATQQISSTGPKIWNSLPLNLRQERTVPLKRFTRKVTDHLIEAYIN